jgi:phosphotransferase system HPr-like phosphotransfer protein
MKKYPQYNIRVRGPKGGEGSATSIIELMLFDANKGRKLGFKIRGEDPSKIESIIRDLFENVFPKIDEGSL